MASGKRIFKKHPVVKCYNEIDAFKVNEDLFERLSQSSRKNIVQKLTVPKKSAKAWEVKAGQTCRFIVAHGPQVGDVNIWNLNDTNERFFSGKTRAIHRTHLSQYDRLWSSFPYLRPMATITQDSLKDYGFDEDGLGIHDVIGTRCDPYVMERINPGTNVSDSCHQYLCEAVAPYGLKESDVHDVFNIFMCTGFHKQTGQYVVRGSPAEVGDYIEVFAEFDLLVALSACPHGDVSIPCGEHIPDDKCFGLDVEVGQPEEALLEEWRNTKK